MSKNLKLKWCRLQRVFCGNKLFEPAMFTDLSLGYGYLPVVWAFFTSFTFLLCYGIAVSKNHIYPFVPAISDTGAQIPEASIFSELFNFSMVLMVLSLIVRYLQFEMLTKGLDSTDPLLNRLNKVGLGCGLVSALGGTIIANFPSKEVRSRIGFLTYCKKYFRYFLASESYTATLIYFPANRNLFHSGCWLNSYWERCVTSLEKPSFQNNAEYDRIVTLSIYWISWYKYTNVWYFWLKNQWRLINLNVFS